MTRLDALDVLYELLAELSRRVDGPRFLKDSTAESGWPTRGVYFFFEDGEIREDGETPRVVRVGTHAVSRGSKTTLWNRLQQHKGTTRGRHSGGGNHRGSIFRLHVGSALLAIGTFSSAIGKSWGQGSSADRNTCDTELPVERAVSTYIRNMPFLWVGIAGEASPFNDRSVVESGAISLLSNRGRPAIDPPSKSWLGLHAARPAIRESGLWNVNHVDGNWSPEFLRLLDGYIQQM